MSTCGGGEAAGAAMGRGLGFNVGAATITAARTSTGTSSQTFDRRFRWWKGFAHPRLLNLLWMDHVALAWRIPGHRCRDATRRRRSTVPWRTSLHVRIIGW